MSDLDINDPLEGKPIAGVQLALVTTKPEPRTFESLSSKVMDYETEWVEVAEDVWERLSFSGYSRRTVIIKSQVRLLHTLVGDCWVVNVTCCTMKDGGDQRTKTWENQGFITNFSNAKGVATKQQARYLKGPA